MEVDINLLRDYKLTPTQYYIIYLLHYKNYSDCNKLISILKDQSLVKYNLDYLEKNNFIKKYSYDSIDLAGEIHLKNKAHFLFEEVDLFDELLEEYPIKVTRPDGTKDYLKTDVKRCRKNYKKIATSNLKHRRIIEALKFEKKVRENENSWKYMKRLPKWLSSEEWKVFEERMKDEENIDKESLGYGQELI